MLCIVRLLQEGGMDMAKLMLCMVLAVDDKFNPKVRSAYDTNSLYTALENEQLLNRKFISYSPYFINAIIMLRQLKCLGIAGRSLYVENNIFDVEMRTHSRRMARIYSASDNIKRLFGSISVNEMYNKLGIQL